MASIANSLFDRNKDVVKELIGNMAFELLPQTDPIFMGMLLPEFSTESDSLGRDMLFKKRFYGSLTGVIQGAQKSNQFTITGDQTTSPVGAPKLFRNLPQETFPDPREGPNPNPFNLAGTIYAIETNFLITLSMLQLDATPANIKQHVVPVFRGFARNIAQWAANSWYLDREQQFRYSELGPSSGTGSYTVDPTTNFTITFFPPQREVRRYIQGQAVEIRKISDNTLVSKSDTTNARARLFVASADVLKNKVVLASEETATDGTAAPLATWDGNLGDSTEQIVLADQTDASDVIEGLYSWRDWYKFPPDSGATNAQKRLLGSSAITANNEFIDVTQHPEFQSFHASSVGPLTETKLLAHLDTMESMFEMYGYFVDTLIAASGIWLNVFDIRRAKERVDRTNRPGSITNLGLGKGFGIESQTGRVYTGVTSRYLEKQTIIGTRIASNWSLVVPPDPDQLSRAGTQMNEVPKIPLIFVNEALSGSDRFPITSGGLLTEAAQFPAMIRMQYAPREQIPGAVWEGVDDNVILST